MTQQEAWQDYRARLSVSLPKISEGIEALLFEAFNAGWLAGHAGTASEDDLWAELHPEICAGDV